MINNSWDTLLNIVWNSQGFKSFIDYINNEYNTKTIYPEKQDIFNSLKLTSYDDVKVVIIGQDPYHEKGQAHGLSFSVKKGIALPPSLKNIYKELKDDLGIPISESGDLTRWAIQGVLLLNSVLTVEEGKPGSHRNIGWERLTDYIIKLLNNKETPVVFILWGNYAKEKKKFITNHKHLVIESAHPSPLSCKNFFGSKPFSKTNAFLEKNKIKTINW